MKDQDGQPGLPDAETIQREARLGRKFSLADVIAQAGGGSLMRGGTPVSDAEVARHTLLAFLDRHLSDAALEAALMDWVRAHPEHVERELKHPLGGLLRLLEETVRYDGLFTEFVRQVDVHYGRIMQEPPHFQKPGEAPHPDDEHTFDSVRATLSRLIAALRDGRG
jgi:hypothetical protein